MRRTTHLVVAGALALALVASACGDDDGDAANTTAAAATTAAATTAAPATTAANASTTAKAADTTAAATTAASTTLGPATGDPVKVMQIVLDSPELGLALPEAQASLKGRIDRLNQEGGVAGRPVEIEVCQAGFDPNKANECAQKAIDGKYLALVGGNFAAGGDYHDLLAAAGIPEIGYAPYAVKDGTTPNGYPVSAGGNGPIFAAAHRIVEEFSPKSVAVMHTDSAGGAQSLVNAKTVLEPLGVEVVAVPVPRNQPDLSAVIQTAMQEDAILNFATGGDLAKIMGGLKQAGYTNSVIAAGAILPALANALGPALEGQLATTAWATPDMDTEGYQQFLDDLASVDSSLPPDLLALESWVAGDLLALIGPALKTADAATLTAALAKVTDYDAGGVMTPIDFSKPGTVIPDQPAIRRNTALNCTFKGGVCLVDDPTWYDALTGK